MAKPTPAKKAAATPTAFEPKGYEPKRIYQKILSEDLFEALALDPKAVPYMYLENVITRAFARIIGQGPYGPVAARCTPDGSLAVVSRGGAFDAYLRQDHTFAAADEVIDLTFPRQVERIDIFTYTGKVDYQLTRDLVQPYGDKIPLFEDSFYSLDFYTRKIRGTCVTYSPATPTRSTVFGWYRLEG